MADLVITSDSTGVEVVFNDSATVVGMVQGKWDKTMIHSVIDKTDYIEVYIAHEHRWIVRSSATTYAGALLIDSIDATTVTTHAQLYTLLKGFV